MNIGTSQTLGEVLNQFVGYTMQMKAHKDANDVISYIEGHDEAKRLFRSIKSIASYVLMTKKGEHKQRTIDSLMLKFNYEVVCLEKNDKEWLTVGIKTPLGIIVYD